MVASAPPTRLQNGPNAFSAERYSPRSSPGWAASDFAADVGDAIVAISGFGYEDEAGPEQAERPDFLTFLATCRIEDTYRGVIAYELWPHIREVAQRLEAGDNLILLKARQLGISWLAAAYMVWRAQEYGATILALSQGQIESYELLRKCRSIAELALAGVGELIKDNNGELGFTGGGRILALPATQRAGRGYTASLVVADEAAFHPWAAENYAAYWPTIADGGQALIISTSAGQGGWFYEMWEAAETGTVPFSPMFIGPFARPDRDDAWWARTVAAYAALPAELAREYPRTAADAFQARSGLVYGMAADGVRLFDPDLTVALPRCKWSACTRRIVTIDPGGSDPTGLMALGIDSRDHMHVYDSIRHTGLVGAEQMSTDLAGWESHGHIDAVLYDPSQAAIGATLAAMGWPAYPANNDRGYGFQLVADNLHRRNLTISAEQKELTEEFNSYWWVDRKANAVGGINAFATRTGKDHHGELMDCLRYGVCELVRGAWRSRPAEVAAPSKPQTRLELLREQKRRGGSDRLYGGTGGGSDAVMRSTR